MKGLSAVLSMQDINRIALEHDIQQTHFKIICLARQSQIEPSAPACAPPNPLTGTRLAVYNVLVKSEGLLNIRREVYELYLQRGGDPSNFDPELCKFL